MWDQGTINEFDVYLHDLINESLSLEEKMSKEKLVRKILWSQPQRFKIKATAIEEAQDIT